MGASTRKKLIDLMPFMPDDPVHVAELTRQRELCGWNVQAVDKWRQKVRDGVKGLQWIFRADNDDAKAHFAGKPLPEDELKNLDGSVGPRSPDPNFKPIGHVSLDWVDEVGEEELASKEKGNVTISSFFILASQQGLGLGNVVMDELEALAASPAFNARWITLNTLDRDAATSAEWWSKTLYPYDPLRRVNEDWYAGPSRKYEVFRRWIPRYEEKDKDGKHMLYPAVYMRKRLNVE